MVLFGLTFSHPIMGQSHFHGTTQATSTQATRGCQWENVHISVFRSREMDANLVKTVCPRATLPPVREHVSHRAYLWARTPRPRSLRGRRTRGGLRCARRRGPPHAWRSTARSAGKRRAAGKVATSQGIQAEKALEIKPNQQMCSSDTKCST